MKRKKALKMKKFRTYLTAIVKTHVKNQKSQIVKIVKQFQIKSRPHQRWLKFLKRRCGHPVLQQGCPGL